MFSPFSDLRLWLLLAEKDREHGEQLQQQRQALLGPGASHQVQGNLAHLPWPACSGECDYMLLPTRS